MVAEVADEPSGSKQKRPEDAGRYEPPKLVRYGRLADITRASGLGPGDSNNAQALSG